ncbi:MAG: DUF348 domain-containing protein [Phycisphaerae bacterium]|nr:DUF348 domain-containing protein [Phycisphaerae bacterium]
MTISIDGQEITQLETTGRTVGDILNEVRASLLDHGRMIVTIICDGQTVTPDQITETLAQPVEKYSSIDFQSADPNELLQNSLAACQEFMIAIRKDLAEVVDGFRQSRVQEAVKSMGPIFGLLNQMYQGVFGIFKLINRDPESVEFSWGTADQLFTGMVDQLRQIKQSLENNDYVQLADLLEYEMGTMLERWQELIDRMNTMVENADIE